MKATFKYLLSAMALVTLPLSASEIGSTANIHIPKTAERIKVDANLDESAWKNAKKIMLTKVTWPDENLPAPVKTEAFVIEDGSTLYVAFKAYDPNPENIRAFLSDRDSNWSDDRVGIKIDTFHDHALAYQFFINPLGTQTDAIENEITKQESAAWDVIWDSAGKLTDYGYVVEVAIPLRALNFNDGLDIQTWGMEFVRFYPRDKELRLSNGAINHDNACWICQMVTVTGFEGAKQGNNFTAIPTLVSGSSETRDITETSEWSEESNTDVGLDLKWGITPDITLNATFNPDFSQVEADSGQLAVNNTFALFTPERRSFFVTNQDYFSTPVNLVYTRNINAPDYGAKVSGKLSQHSFGAFVANDQSTSFLMPGNLGSGLYVLEEKSDNGVVRYRYDIGGKSSVGGLTTYRKSDSYHNYVTSIDAKHKFSEQDTLNVQVMNSDTYMSDELMANISEDVSSEQQLRLNSINTTDNAYRIDYRHNSRDGYFNVSHINIGRDFRADLAFFNNADHIKTVIGGGRNWRSNDTWWNRIDLQGDWDRTTDQNGDQLEQEIEMFVNVRGPKNSFIRHGIVARERVASRIDDSLLTINDNSISFDETEFRSWMEFKPTSNLWLGNFILVGKNIDFANSQLADSFVIEPNVSWNVNQHLSTRLNYKYNRLDKDGENLYVAKLADFRVTYQFSIRSFLRFSMVHFDIERNLENYSADVRDDYDKTFKSLSSQLLFSYKLNPQTLFFLGYSDGGYQNDDFDKITKDNKNVFMKLSYAWQL
jgi:hypothetical protein